ncbi:288_t:CDS:2, partial [Entrophospora sp. SA101]
KIVKASTAKMTTQNSQLQNSDSLPTKSSMEEIPVFNVPEMKKEENKPEKAIPTQPEDLVASTPRNSKIITPKVINSSEIIEIPSPVSDKLEISHFTRK